MVKHPLVIDDLINGFYFSGGPQVEVVRPIQFNFPMATIVPISPLIQYYIDFRRVK